jgi:hypothetical protein
LTVSLTYNKTSYKYARQINPDKHTGGKIFFIRVHKLLIFFVYPYKTVRINTNITRNTDMDIYPEVKDRTYHSEHSKKLFAFRFLIVFIEMYSNGNTRTEIFKNEIYQDCISITVLQVTPNKTDALLENPKYFLTTNWEKNIPIKTWIA